MEEIQQANQAVNYPPTTPGQTADQYILPVKPPVNGKLILIISFILLILVLVFGVGVYYYSQNASGKIPPESVGTPIPSVSINVSPISAASSSINYDYIYLKNNDLFLVHGQETKQLTKEGDISKFKKSKDGGRIGYITDKEFDVESTIPGSREKLPVSLSVLDLKTNKIQKVVEAQYTPIPSGDRTAKNKFNQKTINGFDFIDNEGNSIVFSRNGIYKKDLLSGREELLLEEKFGSDIAGIAARSYEDFSWNGDKYLLINVGLFESMDGEVYDLEGRKKLDLTNLGCQGLQWGSEKNTLIKYAYGGMCSISGLWLTNVLDGKTIRVIGKGQTPEEYMHDPSVSSVSVSKGGQMVILMGSFEGGNENWKVGLPVQEQAVYTLEKDGKSSLIFNPQKTVINRLDWTPNGEKISYLVDNTGGKGEQKDRFDLNIMNKDGTNSQTVANGISDFAFLPKTP